MAYKIKYPNKELGRKRENYKIRNLEVITPKGFEFEKVEGKTAIYKRKRMIKKEDEKK
jgi:hypothetical protein